MTTLKESATTHRILLAAALALAVLAAGIAAANGIDHDQMISYQFALRVLQGQHVYSDFAVPHGPVAGLFFVPFLLVAPTGGWAMILASIALNVVATWLMWAIVRRAGGSAWHACAAAAITAMWYTTVVGTYYHDHVAFAFVLGALLAWLRRQESELGMLLPAILLALAFHAKQTVGLVGVAAIGTTLLVQRGTRIARWPVVRMALYYACTHAVVLGLIGTLADVGTYIVATYTIPAAFFVHKPFWNLITGLLVPYGVFPWQATTGRALAGALLFLPLVATAYLSYAGLWRSRANARKDPAALALIFLLVATLWSCALLGRSFTEAALGIGGIFALGGLLVRIPARWMATAGAGLCVLAIPFIAAHAIGAPAVGDAGDMRPVRIVVSDIERFGSVNASDVLSAAEYLRGRPGSIATIDDSVFLVPLVLRRAPVQPDVEYHEPLTVPSDPVLRAQWERAFVGALERRSAQYIVSSLGDGTNELRLENTRALDTLPLLRAYLDENFALEAQFGQVKVYKRSATSAG
jgi:hypothetical protein